MDIYMYACGAASVWGYSERALGGVGGYVTNARGVMGCAWALRMTGAQGVGPDNPTARDLRTRHTHLTA